MERDRITAAKTKVKVGEEDRAAKVTVAKAMASLAGTSNISSEVAGQVAKELDSQESRIVKVILTTTATIANLSKRRQTQPRPHNSRHLAKSSKKISTGKAVSKLNRTDGHLLITKKIHVELSMLSEENHIQMKRENLYILKKIKMKFIGQGQKNSYSNMLFI